MKQAMIQRFWWITTCMILVICCKGYHNDPFLDSSIPRVVTPPEQIATVRTKWVNGKLVQTTFLDNQDRVLEDFLYGRTSQKVQNQYVADLCTSTTTWYHDDSAPSGYVTIYRSRFDYDGQGRVIQVVKEATYTGESGTESAPKSVLYTYRYVGKTDTLISPSPTPELNRSTVVDSVRWERNRQGQLVRHFQLCVMKWPQDPRPDTIYYFSHRFVYDKLGRRHVAWYDLQYLGQFYRASGPDTIRYAYGQRNRLVQEIQQYTTDRRNKREIDTTSLNEFGRRNVRDNRERFFDQQRTYFKQDRTDTVEYRYETFSADKHLPLHVSQDIGY